MKTKILHKIIACLDLTIITILCFIFATITFNLPLEQILPQTQATYARLFAAILLGSAISLAIFIIIDATYLWPHLKSPPKKTKLKILTLSKKQTTTIVSKNKFLKKIAQKTSLNIAKDLVKANQTQSPYKIAAKTLIYTLTTLFITTPIALTLALTLHPTLIAIMATPLIPLTYYKIKLKSATGDRKRQTNNELPFFTIYASILQSVGVNLYNSLTQTINKNIFPQIQKDALIIKRNSEFFFKNPTQTLEETAKIHPNEKMKTLLFGYTSEYRSGGDTTKYLEAKADELLKDMQFKWKNYAQKTQDIGELTIALLFVLPLMILMTAFVFPNQATTLIAATTTIAIPTSTLIIFQTINSAQPKTNDTLKGNLKLALTTATITLIITTLILKTPLWLNLAATLAAATTFYGITIHQQIKQNNQTEKMLPQFLRDLTEYRKMGYDTTQAIIKISQENTYNPTFNKLLKKLTNQIKLGKLITEIQIPTQSYLTKTSFFLIAQIVETGGGTPSTMEKLTHYINQITQTKKETQTNMKLYQTLSLLTPIGLSLITAIMITLMTNLTTNITPHNTLNLITNIPQLPQPLIESSYLLILSASTSTALLTAKTTNLTAKNTLHITINMALAAISIAISNQIATNLLNTLNTIP